MAYTQHPVYPGHAHPGYQQPVVVNPVDNLLKPMSCYSDKVRISTDVQDVLRQINSLQPAVGQFVQNDGRTSTLLQLHGTVPIYFKGNQYNIPVTLWIGEKYPLVPPTCYVTPTKDMRIKPRHRHVDNHGMVYLPYLNQWNIKSTLVELITFMSSVFSEDPPVYKHNPELDAIEQRKKQEEALQRFAPPAPKEPTKEELETKKRDEMIEVVTAKLQKGLESYNRTITSEIDSLFDKQRLLMAGADKIKAGMEASEKDKGRMLDALKKVDEQIASIKTWLDANENNQQTNVDDLVFVKDTWSSQMFDLVAEDNAIEDTLYQLDRALADGRVELTDFLREVRKLAHKQFMARALAIKVVDLQREEYTKGSYAQSPPLTSSAVTQARLSQPGGPWPTPSNQPGGPWPVPPSNSFNPAFAPQQQFIGQHQFQQPYQQPIIAGYPGARR